MPAILATSEDLSTRARIREAALELFATHGVSGTSIRAVAEAAAVSPGLVIHHFGSKEGLRNAVDEAVVAQLDRAAVEIDPAPGKGELIERQAEELAAAMRASPLLTDYIGRTLLAGGEASASLFERIVDRARAGIRAQSRAGRLRKGVDRDWGALQLVFLLCGPFMLRSLVERELGRSLRDEGELERWMEANVDLLRRGLYK